MATEQQRLINLAKSAKIELNQLTQLSQLTNIALSDLSKYTTEQFMKLCEQHADNCNTSSQGAYGGLSSTPGNLIIEDLSTCLATVRQSLDKISEHLVAENIKDKVPCFSGSEGSRGFDHWLKEIENQQAIHMLSDSATCKLVSRTLSGCATDFLVRLLKLNPDIQWNDLKQKLKERYSNLCSNIIAKQSLHAIKQKPSESIQGLAERIFTASESSFTPTERYEPIVIQELINVFIKALKMTELPGDSLIIHQKP